MVKLVVAGRSRRLIYLHDLLRALVGRDLKSRYKGSALGILWSLMNPLLQLLVFHFIFRLVLRLDIPRYSSFAFSAMLAWNWFQASLLDASGSMLNSRELVKRPGFPVAILPVVAVTTHLIYYLLALPILMVFLIMGGSHLTASHSGVTSRAGRAIRPDAQPWILDRDCHCDVSRCSLPPGIGPAIVLFPHAGFL